MTNQEAIRIIKEYEMDGGNIDFVYDALEMALSALEFRDRYDQLWEEIKTAGMNGREIEIRHSGRTFRIREVAQ